MARFLQTTGDVCDATKICVNDTRMIRELIFTYNGQKNTHEFSKHRKKMGNYMGIIC